MNSTNATTNPVNFDQRSSTARRVFGVVAQPQSYLNLTYLLLGLPLGTVWFAVLIAGVSVGFSMLIVALLGIPILLGLWYVIRSFANIERRLASTFLGQRLASAPLSPPVTGKLWARLRSMSEDRDRWRELGYLMLRFPVGIATFTVAVTLTTTSVAVVYAPFYARYVSHSFGNWSMATRLDRIASGSPWSWLLVPAGAMALIASFNIVNVMARASGRWAAAWLGPVNETCVVSSSGEA